MSTDLPPFADRGHTTGDVFATTRWALVFAAGRPDEPHAAAALEELCRTYWYPLYAYVRRHGRTKEDAEDLTQAFFAQLLRRNDFEGLDRSNGRFRAFLLASLKHFLANEHDRARRLKRGGGVPLLSLNWDEAETRYHLDPADTASPDKLYDRAWAVTLLERVLVRLREEAGAAGDSGLFERLRPFLTPGDARCPYAEVARQAGISEGALRVAVHRLRRSYRELLRQEIAQTLADPAQVADELQALFGAFQA